MRAAVLVLACLVLAGCADKPEIAAPAAPAPVLKPVSIPCAHGKAWTPAERRALADALVPISAASPVWTMEYDWQSYADQAAACRAAQTGGAP